MKKRWTNEEVDFLKNNINKLSVEEIAKKLNKTVHSIRSKAYSLELSTESIRRKWTNEEIDYLKEKIGCMSMYAISKKLRRSINTIRIKCFKLGIGCYKNNTEYYTFKEAAEELDMSYWTLCYYIKKWN